MFTSCVLWYRDAVGAGVPAGCVRGGLPRQAEQGRQVRRPGAGGGQGPPRVRRWGLHRVHPAVSHAVFNR